MMTKFSNLHFTQRKGNYFYHNSSVRTCFTYLHVKFIPPSRSTLGSWSMACFERASPALKEILLRLYRYDVEADRHRVCRKRILLGRQKKALDRDERAIDADHHLHEFGSVEYYIQSLVSDPDHTYLSISTPILSQAFLISTQLSRYTIEKVKAISAEVVEIVEPPKEGYQLTLRLNFARMPHESIKMITDIAAVQGVILSSQLEEMLMNVNSQDVAQGRYKPIKLVYHPREPFYVIKQPQKITAVFPMRFKEKTDVIIATAFFQELMDVANTKGCAKAPHCIWSPIPPPELRGEAIEDLSTNGGFVSFDITSRHTEGKRLDKTVWNLLNFYAFVKNHVKCTRGFIQRRMRTCLKSLVEVLQKTGLQDEQQIKEVKGYKRMKKLVNFTKFKILRRRSDLTSKLKRIHSRLKIHVFSHFRRKWLKFPTFSSKTKYRKLEKDISLQHNQ